MTKRMITLRHPKPYFQEQFYARNDYDVVEGDRFELFVPGIKRAEDKTVEVIVERVDRYFITLRYPAGYCESMRWHEFMNVTKRKLMPIIQ